MGVTRRDDDPQNIGGTHIRFGSATWTILITHTTSRSKEFLVPRKAGGGTLRGHQLRSRGGRETPGQGFFGCVGEIYSNLAESVENLEKASVYFTVFSRIGEKPRKIVKEFYSPLLDTLAISDKSST